MGGCATFIPVWMGGCATFIPVWIDGCATFITAWMGECTTFISVWFLGGCATFIPAWSPGGYPPRTALVAESAGIHPQPCLSTGSAHPTGGLVRLCRAPGCRWVPQTFQAMLDTHPKGRPLLRTPPYPRSRAGCGLHDLQRPAWPQPNHPHQQTPSLAGLFCR